eukprot:TRINITY_DN59543_c0_g1_i1.p1 TRINITY_DN59543_c0_g1~~TRINITY_DN59543_c0_g1_i1.p1  ORF type:complete len:733 (+),score=145.11 TRINITY_DN59543_c0_g1_i1:105-2303(+)
MHADQRSRSVSPAIPMAALISPRFAQAVHVRVQSPTQASRHIVHRPQPQPQPLQQRAPRYAAKEDMPIHGASGSITLWPGSAALTGTGASTPSAAVASAAPRRRSFTPPAEAMAAAQRPSAAARTGTPVKQHIGPDASGVGARSPTCGGASASRPAAERGSPKPVARHVGSPLLSAREIPADGKAESALQRAAAVAASKVVPAIHPGAPQPASIVAPGYVVRRPLQQPASPVPVSAQRYVSPRSLAGDAGQSRSAALDQSPSSDDAKRRTRQFVHRLTGGLSPGRQRRQEVQRLLPGVGSPKPQARMAATPPARAPGCSDAAVRKPRESSCEEPSLSPRSPETPVTLADADIFAQASSPEEVRPVERPVWKFSPAAKPSLSEQLKKWPLPVPDTAVVGLLQDIEKDADARLSTVSTTAADTSGLPVMDAGDANSKLDVDPASPPSSRERFGEGCPLACLEKDASVMSEGSSFHVQMLASTDSLKTCVTRAVTSSLKVGKRLPAEKEELRQQLAALRQGNLTLLAEIEKVRLERQRAQLLAVLEREKAEAADAGSLSGHFQRAADTETAAGVEQLRQAEIIWPISAAGKVRPAACDDAPATFSPYTTPPGSLSLRPGSLRAAVRPVKRPSAGGAQHREVGGFAEASASNLDEPYLSSSSGSALSDSTPFRGPDGCSPSPVQHRRPEPNGSPFTYSTDDSRSALHSFCSLLHDDRPYQSGSPERESLSEAHAAG